MSSAGACEQIWSRSDANANNRNFNLVVDSGGGTNSVGYFRMLNDAANAGNTVLTMSATNDITSGLSNGTNSVQFNNSGASNGIRVGIGIEAPDCPLFVGNVTGVTAGTLIFHLTRPGTADNLLVYASDSYAPNGAAASMKIGSISSTNRSINATGTINASGADYAEYIECERGANPIAGQVCGIDSNGMITLNHSCAIRYVVISTNPSFVGGDSFNPSSKNNIDATLRSNIKNYSITSDKMTMSIGSTLYAIVSFCGRTPVNKRFIKNKFSIGDYLYVDDPDDACSHSIMVTSINQISISLNQFLKSIGQIIKIDLVSGNPIIIVR